MKFNKIFAICALAALSVSMFIYIKKSSKEDWKSIWNSNASLDIRLSKLKSEIESKYAKINKKMFEIRQIKLKSSLDNNDNIKAQVNFVLSYMTAIDQSIREILIEEGKKQNASKNSIDALTTLEQDIDQKNTMNLKEILKVSNREWFKISEFGEAYDANAWLLCQHADHDGSFQENILLRLEKLIKVGDTNKINFAYLYDRVATGKNKLQKYGTQIDLSGGQIKPFPVEEEDKLDQRRADIGLSSMEVYMEEIKKMYVPPQLKKTK